MFLVPIVSNDEVLTYMQAAAGVCVAQNGLALLTMIQPMVEAAVKKLLGYNLASGTYTEYYPESLANGYFDGDDIVSAGYDLVGEVAVPRTRSQREFSVIQLCEMPVRTITSVYENPGAWATEGGSFPSGNLLPANAYFLDARKVGFSNTGQLRRISGTWSRLPRTVKITYTAGYSANEINQYFPQAKLAVLITLAKEYISAVMRAKAAQMFGPVASVGIEDFSVSFMQNLSGLFGGGTVGLYTIPPEAVAYLAPYINPAQYVGV